MFCSHPSPSILQTRRAVFLLFFLCGFVFANWAARIPTLMDVMQINESQMGWILVCAATGSSLALPLTGWIISQLGTVSTARYSFSLLVLGYLLVAFSPQLRSFFWLGVGMFCAGTGFSICDVTMNLEGTRVEQRMQRTIMPQFHAFYSLGTVTGASLGAGVEYLHLGYTGHLAIILCAGWVASGFAVYYFFAPVAAAPQHETSTTKSNLFTAWLEWRTLLIGLVVLGGALAEGAATDWLARAVVTGFVVDGAAPAYWMGALCFALFVAAITAMRWFGTRLLDRFGRVIILRISFTIAIIGLAIFGLVPYLPIAAVGILLWGLGVALGFPVGMSAASDEPARAPARVAVVASVGYCAFLAGPPLLGFLGERWGIRQALLTLMLPLSLALLAIPVLHPPKKP